MLRFKNPLYVIVPVILLFVTLTGCGASRPKDATTAGSVLATDYEPMEIPEKIPRDETTLYERDLLLTPVDHPSRLVLRDKIVAGLAEAFEALPEEDIEGRLDLFKEALEIHHPFDFKPDGVAAEAAPMAGWVADTFGRRGDEAVVLAALRYQMLLKPSDVEIKEAYLELYDWSDSIRRSIPEPVSRLSSLIQLFRRMVELVPDREVVEHLAKLYVARYQLVMAIFSSDLNMTGHLRPDQILAQSRVIQNAPIELIHAYELTGNPAGARTHLEELNAGGGRIVEYLELLDNIFHSRNAAASYFTLANHLAQVDPYSGLRTAIAAREADPEDSRFPLFIGMLYEELDRSECAFDFFVEAATLAPSEDVLMDVLEMYSLALGKVAQKGLESPLEQAIDVGDGLVKQILDMYPDKDRDIRIVTASFLYSMGEIEYYMGNVEGAIGHMDRSFEVMGNMRSLVKLAETYYMLGKYKDGIEALDRVSELMPEGQNPTGYWQAILLENRGNLADMLGKTEQALRHWRGALIEWDSAEVPTDQTPIIAIRRGILLDRLGDLKGSLESFTQAVQLDPDREATYAELISFLVIRDRLEDAKRFYRLAHNQDQIDDEQKIYYSLWVEALSQRVAGESFDLASGYLAHTEGESWADFLAQYFSGVMKEEELRGKASNLGQEVEADYYSALKAIVRGDAGAAKERLQNVIASNLVGFYEFRMAKALLHAGQLKPGTP